MKIAQAVFGPSMRPRFERGDLGGEADLVLLFGAADALAESGQFERMRARHPQAIVVACSSRLGICGTHALENSLVETAVRFERTTLHIASLEVPGARHSGAAGVMLADALPRRGLSHVLVFGDALAIDAAAVSAAIRAGLPAAVGVSGWLTGGSRDAWPALVCADRPAASGVVVLLGLYGPALSVAAGVSACGCKGAPPEAAGAQFAIVAGAGAQGDGLKPVMEADARNARLLLGEQAALAGFAAHAELCAVPPAPCCALHGVASSLTVLSER
jgi:hypothetical protein